MDYNRNDLVSALTFIDPGDRDTRIKIVAALASVNERDICEQWLEPVGLPASKINSRWKSFKQSGSRTTPNTIFFLARQNGWTGGTTNTLPPKPSKPPEPAKPIDWAKNRHKLQNTWRSAVSENHPDFEPLYQYLQFRGLRSIAENNDVPRVLRLHPSLGYYHERKYIASFPAMLALVQDSAGKPVSIHRTYLRPDGNGKADVLGSAKKIMSPAYERALTGSAIQLYPAGNILAVAEGLETALAIRIATGLPVWAARDCYCLSILQVPEIVREVIICADRDEHGKGEEKAKVLAARLAQQHIIAKIILPKQIGGDWLDVLNQEAA